MLIFGSITKMPSNGFKLAQDMFKLLVSSKGFDRVMDKVGCMSCLSTGMKGLTLDS